MDTPSLPSGQLGVLVLSASAALLFFAIASSTAAFRRQKQDAIWAAVPLLLVGVTMVAGRVHSALHFVFALLVLGVVGRNIVRQRGVVRVLQAAGGAAYLVSMLMARQLFGG